MSGGLLFNSLVLAGLTTAGAVVWGAAAAGASLVSGRTGRRGLLVSAVLVLALPPFLVANCWLPALGPNGWLRGSLLDPLASSVGAMPGGTFAAVGSAAWVMSLLFWPISFLWMAGAWQRLQRAHLELEPRLAGWALVRWWLWPATRGPLGQAALLTFVLALNHFAVPALFQVKVYPAEIWIRFSTRLDVAGALVTSAPLVVVALLLLVWWRERQVSWPRWQSIDDAAFVRERLGRAIGRGCRLVTGLVLVLSLVLPLSRVAGDARTWSELGPAIRAGAAAWGQSVGLAAAAATLMVAVSVVGSRMRLGFWLWLPFLLPGVLVGIGCILLFHRPPFLLLFQSCGIVIVAWTLRYLAVSWTATRSGLQAVDRRLVDVVRLEGGARWQRFRLVDWPQAGGLLLVGWYVAFLLCLWDTETLVLIQPPGGETLALRIFNFLHYGYNAQVNALCLVLLVTALLPLLLWLAVGRWIGRALGRSSADAALPRRLGPPWRREPRDGEVGTPGLGRPGNRVSLASACGRPRPGVPTCSWRCVARWLRLAGGRPAVGLALAVAGLLLSGCAPSSDTEAALHSALFERVQVIGTRGTGLGQFNKPRSVAVDAQDRLYVVDMTARVQRFSAAGEYEAYWQMPQTDLGKPKGMCQDEQGNIVVIEPHYAKVNHFTPAGKLVEQWGRLGTNVGDFTFPRSVAVTPQGRVFVSEYSRNERVQLFGRDRTVARVIGGAGTGPGKFNRPEGMCLDALGRLYVADSCNHRVQVFGADGGFLRSYGSPGSGPGEMSYPYDVQVDATGRQYVCEFGNSRVQVFAPDGRLLETLGGAGAAPGQLNNPWSVALDSRGNLYVADAMNHRVQKFIRRAEIL